MSVLIAVAIAAAALIALYLNGRGYRARVEARWPPQGRFVDVDGAKMHVVEQGRADAPAVLLIHGANANLLEVLPPLSALAADHRLLALDRPGYGYSQRPRGAETLAVQARLAARVLEACSVKQAVVLGHSLGAAVALRLALDRPDLVRGLVLVAPASHPYPGNNAWWAQLAAAPVIGWLFAHTIVPLVAPLVRAGGVANTFAPAQAPDGYVDEAAVPLAFRPRAFMASARDVCATKAEFAAQAPRYGEIYTPTVIVSADKDRVVSPQRHARALSVELAAAELVTAPGAGHMPHRIRPDLLIEAVRRVEAMAAVSANA